MNSGLISIHALREEGDMSGSDASYVSTISIHALREEGDRKATTTMAATTVFLSTPSARRATSRQMVDSELVEISIHALREEGDAEESGLGVSYIAFLSTPSARRATPCPLGRGSIAVYFYPRPPRGGRQRR